MEHFHYYLCRQPKAAEWRLVWDRVMLRWSEDEKKNAVLKEYVPNYRINLIDAGNLEHLERFKSDLQEVLGMIQCRGDKENLLKYINERKE
ncbi:hypothetical protein ACTNBF_16595, partial [Bariatricus sp. HCP28S3_A4]